MPKLGSSFSIKRAERVKKAKLARWTQNEAQSGTRTLLGFETL